MNFLVALIDDSNKKASEKNADPDVLQYIGKSVSKLRKKTRKSNKGAVYIKYDDQIN